MAKMSTISHDTPIEAIIKKDRIIVISGLAGISLLAWAYMVYLAWGVQNMDIVLEMSKPQTQSWGPVDFVLTFVMWTVMMTAMMVPAATPMIVMFATINRKRSEQQGSFVSTSVFLVGYMMAWAGYSVLAVLAQWCLHTTALLSPLMTNTSPILGGVLLLTAGIFQFTPLKYACLTRCRSPLGFLLNEWQEGARGAFMMGLRNGNYCVVCCWALMALMFVAGVMNLLWMALIAAFVLVEKVVPGGQWVSRISGLLLLIWGTWMLAGI